MEFTKEQLIARAEKRKELVAMFPDSKLAQMDLVLAELALAMLTAKPFMYAIADPAGEPHFDENCVSCVSESLGAVMRQCDELNEMQCEHKGDFTLAPLYRLPEIE